MKIISSFLATFRREPEEEIYRNSLKFLLDAGIMIAEQAPIIRLIKISTLSHLLLSVCFYIPVFNERSLHDLSRGT